MLMTLSQMGCWDGTVALWKLPTAAGSPLQLLSHFLADSVPIRTIAWAPPHKDGTIDSHGRHCFLTAGHASSMKIWDVRSALAAPQAWQFQIQFAMEDLEKKICDSG